jgi:hypothetical protein
VLAVALASLAWASIPSSDSQGWVLWGRELTRHGSLSTLWYPSWKPLPLLLTAPFALHLAWAPALWVAAARAGGLAAVLLAARLASRAGGWMAACVAAAALLLMSHWLELTGNALIEPIVLALLLGAADRHLAGHRTWALVLLALAGLGRVEVWPLLGAYGIWLAIREPRRVPLVAAIGIAVPAAWFGGDWLGSGDPVRGGVLARASQIGVRTQVEGDPAVVALRNGASLLWRPVLAAAVATLVLAPWDRDRVRRAVVLLAGGAALAWVVTDVVLAEAGYPGDSRFLVPAGGLACVLAGVGFRRLVALMPGPGRRGALAGALAACAAIAATGMAVKVVDQVGSVHTVAEQAISVDRLVGDLGGHRLLARCTGITIDQPLQTRLAWDLGLSSAAVDRVRQGGLVISRRGSAFWHDLARKEREREFLLRHITRDQGWSVMRVAKWRPPHTRTGRAPVCLAGRRTRA